ncbi:hypothetical protein [Pseudomonas putida]|uniref:Primase C-terminal 1 domain-containing protein n=1 Tax=Pseudomonas putida TaxID=303 RepID=A0A1Q9R6I2_PSEPU|nr:hypothetical protein [Pseudomonas putida]OLS63013.1 hypothetical protein PSEMO_21620 [Pseudomonas putida]
MRFGIQYSAATRQVKNCHAASFKEFYENVLQAESVVEEKSGRTFTPSIFRHPERLIEHAMELSMIVLDVDQKPGDEIITLEEMEDALLDMNFEHCIYTSHSNTAECPRFRVVMPLDIPIQPEALPAVAAAVIECLDGFFDGRLIKVLDRCWQEVSRCYFTFMSHPDRRNAAMSLYNPGRPLCALDLKLTQSSYGLDIESSTPGKPRPPGTAVGAAGRSFELNRRLGGMFRSFNEDQIVQKIFAADSEMNPGSEYFRDPQYARHKPRPGETKDAAALRACRSWVRSHLNWLRRKTKVIGTTIVNRKAQSKEPMPTHEAMIRLKDFKPGKTKAGGETALAEFEIVSGEHAGRYVWHRFYSEGNHPTAIKISNEMLEKLKTAAKLPSISFADALKAKGVIVHARIKLKAGTGGFPDQNEIGTFFTQP